MPSVFNDGSFRVMIYPNDHPPPHVHVWSSDGTEAVIYLSPVSVRKSGMKRNEQKRAIQIVKENHDILLASWYEIHGNDSG